MSMSKLVGTRGREVLRGPLLYRKRGSGSWKRRAVIVYCGSVNDSKQHSACLALYDDYERVEMAGEKKPKKIIQLVGAKIEEPTYASPVGSNGSPGSGGTPPDRVCQFLVILPNETHDFQCQSTDMKVHWFKLLTLLTMFPHSVIPEEPSTNPISEVFRYKLDAKAYCADSAWAVYIMPEEVGSRCHMIGIHILLLKSGDERSVGRLEIVSPTDTGKLVVAWDRDKMRRTGKTGNLVFVEIGRRCYGGPGLVWMYAGFEEAHPLRETLHRFLFQGDGKAVSIPASEPGVYSRPRSSVDMGLPSSYQREQSLSNGYQYQHVPSGQMKDVDSGFKDSLMSHPVSPAKHDTPPPIRLDKHPSFRKQRSMPCRVPRGSMTSSRCSMSPSESSNGGAFGHSVGSLNEDLMFESERVTSRQSVSPPDEGYSEAEESGSGQFPMDPDPSSSLRGQRGSEEYTYVTMNSPHVNVGPQEEYVTMVSAPVGSAGTPSRPIVPSHYDVPPPFRRRSLGNGDSVSSSASPSNYENSLPTIEEAPKQRGHSDVYENFSAAKLRDEEFVHYRPSYENMEVVKEHQRNSEAYQNITLVDDGQQGRRGSSYRNRCRSMEKGECRIPTRADSSTPPSNKPHLHYAQHHTQSSATDTTPPVPPRVSVV